MQDDPGTRRPRHGEVEQGEAALPGDLDDDERGLAEAVRAAAAGVQGELTPAAYEEFRERDPDRWPALAAIEERFGSLGVALASAGVDVPDRG
ncbi:MAG TPA: hypothetical protein VHI30_12885 [Gaiellales bacterium]|jgi:hypothetical protein|nr:hypothetical protein [Gaiellales bacterium]